MNEQPRDFLRSPRCLGLVGLCVVLISGVPMGCSSDPSGTVPAGAGRDAPADVPPLYDLDEEEATSSNDGSTPVQDVALEPDPEPDKILREGVVGTVSCITDGDTVHVTVDGWYHRVRLYGINAPECNKSRQLTPDGYQYVCSSDQEYWGLSSAQALSDFALDQQVTVHCDRSPGQACPTDDFDRFLAYLDSANGDLSEFQARNGHALTFTRYPTTRTGTYCEAEYLAIDEDLGMWALGSREQVLARMNENTQDWYEDHDDICEEAMD